MFTGFNVEIEFSCETTYNKEKYYDIGLKQYDKLKKDISTNISNLINNDKIDGDALQNLWFPTDLFKTNKYIFISHSHKDEKSAVELAGYLQETFGILSFIDSCVWGNIIDLNRQLNECSLDKLNYCTHCQCAPFSQNLAYVHMMLSSALMTAIDKCECMFFLNTPSSINIHNKTESPWIYYELNIANIIEKKRPIEKRGRTGDVNNLLLENVEFTANIKNMPKLTYNDLDEWRKCYEWKICTDPFEALYKIAKK
jgi:hypothetical protein